MNKDIGERAFPEEFLKKPGDEKKLFFRQKMIAHRTIKDAKEEILKTLKNPIEGQIIIVIGAPGVGKTTLRRTIIQVVTSQFLATDKIPSYLPIAGIELEAFQSGVFKWKKTHQALLKSLHEPLIDKKVIYKPGIDDNEGQLFINSRISVDDLGEILIDVLKYRQPEALWFDEAQHLIKVSGAQALLHQMDTIKSLANRSQTTLILFGTYEMNVLLELSVQLGRRTKLIYFPRYKATAPEDVEEFRKVLYGLQKNAPLYEEPTWVDNWDYFYEGSLGCIGMLKDWLLQSVGTAIDNDDKTVTLDTCEAWLPRGNLLLTRLVKIQASEDQLEETRDRLKLRTLLGLENKSSKTNNGNQYTKEDNNPSTSVPFQRKPVRDKVGTSLDEPL